VQFNSYSYLLCLALATIVFWALPSRFRRGYVLALSLLFYATWNLYLVVVPFILCTITFLCARVIRANKGQPPARRALKAGIAAILAILAIAKYRRFVISNFSLVIPWVHSHPLPTIVMVGLPLGISFYSFEAVSYLLDTRQERVNSPSFMDLALFIMFWPHLIAGPIVRGRELIPQLKFTRPFETRFVYAGLDRLILGLVQKNFVANSLGSWVDDGFLPKVAALNTTIDCWFLAVAFGLQIYFDFSAYSNMAIGTAQLLGVTLPENFRFPYHAGTPAEFWSRWHMTLSRWIRDYVFFPLNAGLKNKKLQLYASMIGAMGLVGLWHGAGWGYILWGLMHGAYLVIYRAFQGDADKPSPALLRWLGRILTLVAVAAAWIPFRSASLAQAATVLSSMFWRFTFGMSYSVNFYLVTVLACGFCAVEPYLALLVQKSDALGERIRAYAGVNEYLLRPLAYACLLLLFLAFDDRDTQFIYFQF
jgi:alginate O-acetyltransferase complex protein AlgI